MKKTPERFNKAISALVKAFFDGTLAKGTCAACACGNIIHYSNNVLVPKNIWFEDPLLHKELADSAGNAWTDIDRFNYNKSGYSIKELQEIERAFEGTSRIHWHSYKNSTKEQIMEDQYNGLMAVVDVLCELDGIVEKEQYKKMFTYNN